jgi:hypothetical protein
MLDSSQGTWNSEFTSYHGTYLYLERFGYIFNYLIKFRKIKFGQELFNMYCFLCYGYGVCRCMIIDINSYDVSVSTELDSLNYQCCFKIVLTCR